jgi:hypothetical protein
MFCAESIVPTAVDPCSAVFAARWLDSAFKNKTGQYWFHAACLRQRAHPSIPLYFIHAAEMSDDGPQDR